jgi:GxxExxY protein
MIIRPNPIVHEVIGAAIAVHRELGPGLLESVYETCLSHELTLRGVRHQRQVNIPVVYRGVALDCAYRADLVVAESVVVEVKSVSQVSDLVVAQVLTYRKLLKVSDALVINFNVRRLVDGVQRLLGPAMELAGGASLTRPNPQ